MLLRGIAKLVAVIAAAALGGLAIGAALASLSGGSDSSVGQAGGPAPKPAPAKTTTTRTKTKTATTAPAKKPAPAPAKKPATAPRVRVVSATLQLGTLPSRKQRNRARLSVRVQVTNRGRTRLTVPRPELVSGNARLKTDPKQDTSSTNLGALAPGATGNVTLRFETAGAVTQRLERQRQARLTIAGTTVTATITIAGAAGGTRTAPAAGGTRTAP